MSVMSAEAATSDLVAPRGLASFWRAHPVVSIWLLWSALLFAMALPAIFALQAQDPDDYLRLLEVRDLLAGQSWFDVTQYRIDPPHGAAMHWSRLVDLPIAGALIVARLAFAEPVASKVAMTVVPLGQLLLAMTLVEKLTEALRVDRGVRLIAVASLPLSPLLLSCFLPMRIDHHGWQAISALGCALCFVRAPGRRAALIGGSIAALWLSISLEGLPLVVVIAALHGLRFVLLAETSVSWFLTGLAASSLVVHIATRPAFEWMPHCDTVGWPHVAAFAAAAALAAMAVRYRGRSGWGVLVVRVGMLAVIGCVAGAIIILPVGICAVNPFATIDPVMERYWHGVIFEGLPITKQIPSTRLTLIWSPLIVLAAIRTGLPDNEHGLAERRWLWLSMLALLATPISLLVMREGVNLEALTVPFSALLIARYMPQARALNRMLPRALATAAVPLLATPTAASALLKPFDDQIVGDVRFGLPGHRTAATECDLGALATLPASRVFATLDLGPEILVKTPHTVIASGYHRNMAKMREVVEAFSGDPLRSEEIVRGNHAKYVVLCLNDGDTSVFQSRRPDNLANRLVAGQPPRWLQPVTGFAHGGMRVYRVS
jgi:hypothetical protein